MTTPPQYESQNALQQKIPATCPKQPQLMPGIIPQFPQKTMG
jgi:hypothetical protein